MAFELHLQRPLPAELTRLLDGEVDHALSELSGAPGEEAVHAARRHIKKIRALLRLLDGGLPHRALAHCDSELRAAGRALSAARDAAVLRRTIEALAEPHPAKVATKATATALQRLRDTLQPYGNPVPTPAELRAARRALQKTRVALTEYALTDCDFVILAAGFAATYRTGRRALRCALVTPTAERLHALRKALKHHGYQLRLLWPLWPQLLAALRAEADHAAELLGQHHDCAVLRAWLTDSPLSAAQRARIDALAAQRQQDNAQAALATCRRLYAERGRHYARRLQVYWALATAVEAVDTGNKP